MSWIPYDDNRTKEELREHYLIERELASRLRNSSKEERRKLYSSVYDELFRRVPRHSQLQAHKDERYRRKRAEQKLRLVERLLSPETVFLEIGCGDGSFSEAVASRVRKVYALDVSEEIAGSGRTFGNVEFILSDGTSVPVPEESVDVAYSNQLMEHLHSDDAYEQLGNIVRALKPGGAYVCITPNAVSGPHDISQYFSDVAEGFHLKEYSWRELRAMLQSVGFDCFDLYAGGLGWYVRIPEFFVFSLERILYLLPRPLRKMFARSLPGRALLGINVVAWKGRAV